MAQAAKPGFEAPSPVRLAAYCRANGIRRLEVFGSAIRGDFGPGSDLDLLVSFEPGRTPGMFRFHRIEEGLSALFERKVDLVSRAGVEMSRNPIRRTAILDAARTIYSTAEACEQ